MDALKRVVDNLDSVPEPLREAYVEDGGKWRLNADPDDGTELKQTLERVRGELRTAKETLGRYDGVDVEEFRRLKAEAEGKKKADPKNDDELTKKHQRELEERDAQLKAMGRSSVKAQAKAAILAVGGEPDLLLPLVMQGVTFKVANGEFVPQVLNANGDPRVSPSSGNDGPMTIAERVEELKADEKFGVAFRGTGRSGGGASQHGNGGAGAVKTRADLKDAKAKADFIDKHGQDAYLDLPEK